MKRKYGENPFHVYEIIYASNFNVLYGSLSRDLCIVTQVTTFDISRISWQSRTTQCMRRSNILQFVESRQLRWPMTRGPRPQTYKTRFPLPKYGTSRLWPDFEMSHLSLNSKLSCIISLTVVVRSSLQTYAFCLLQNFRTEDKLRLTSRIARSRATLKAKNVA